MVTPGKDSLLGDPYRAIFNGMNYSYPVNLRSDLYSNSLCEKSETVMNMAASGDNRRHEDATGPRNRIAMAVSLCIATLKRQESTDFSSVAVAAKGRFDAVAITAMASHAPTAPTRTTRPAFSSA